MFQGGEGHDASARTGSGDPDVDAAYAELDDYLRKDQTDGERREREAQRKAQEEARARAAGKSSHSGPQAPRPELPIAKDYRLFNLPVGTGLVEVKSAYKRLLRENHPDRHANNPENMRRATEYSAQLNDAFQRIENWLSKRP